MDQTMTAQDDDNSPKMEAAPHPGGGREPRLDVPPMSDRSDSGDADDVSIPERTPDAQPAVNADAELEKARSEAAEYKDRALRAVAELENFRRRAEKEREDVSKYAISNFAREMLPVADNLRRALDAQPAVDDEVAALLKPFIAGVELTERELIAAFERFGLRKVEPLGQPFDHNFHQAMFELDDPNQPPGIVVQVMQPGYVLKDRLLRPALVAVSKGGPAKSSDDRAAPFAPNGAYNSSSGQAGPGGEGHTVDTKA
jgi:molecular chaperone GrpE